MKAIATLLCLLACGTAYGGQYAEAIKMARESNCRIFILFFSDGCRSCQWLKENVLADKWVDKYIRSKYVYYRCNVNEEPDVARLYSEFVKGLPTCVIIDPDAVVYGQMEGAADLEEFKSWLLDTTPPANLRDKAWQDFKKRVDAYVGLRGRWSAADSELKISYRNRAGVLLFDLYIVEKDDAFHIGRRSVALPELDKSKSR